jgi:hypothetical protein
LPQTDDFGSFCTDAETPGSNRRENAPGWLVALSAAASSMAARRSRLQANMLKTNIKKSFSVFSLFPTVPFSSVSFGVGASSAMLD